MQLVFKSECRLQDQLRSEYLSNQEGDFTKAQAGVLLQLAVHEICGGIIDFPTIKSGGLSERVFRCLEEWLASIDDAELLTKVAKFVLVDDSDLDIKELLLRAATRYAPTVLVQLNK